MVSQEEIKKYENAAKQIRRDIIDMTYAAGKIGAHLGGSLSMVEILAALYCGTVRYDIKNSDWSERDRVILSKGHAAMALYSAMTQAGIISRDELLSFKQNGSRISGHPSLKTPGIEFASGSLGQGLSLGVGVCLALAKQKNFTSKVYVLLGDGECDEGSIWEAATSAAHFGLKQLVAIVDENKLQYDGSTKKIMSMEPAKQKWESFGWNVIKLDGHSISALLSAYQQETDKPLAILAQTVKGKGISYMEGNKSFHNSRLTKEQYKQAVMELEASA